MTKLRSDDEIKRVVMLWVRHEVAELRGDGVVKLLEIWRRCQYGCMGKDWAEVNSEFSVDYQKWFY